MPARRPAPRRRTRRRCAAGPTPSIGLGDLADDGGQHLPALAQAQHLGQALGRDDGEHALLALRGHDLEGLHAVLAAGHGGHVEVHAHLPVGRGLAGRAGEPGAAEVLDADDEAGVEQGEAGLDEALLLERVAHLDGGALVLAALVEAGRGQHAHAADAVAAGGRAEQHGQVAGAGGLGRGPGGRPGRMPRHSTLTSGLPL